MIVCAERTTENVAACSNVRLLQLRTSVAASVLHCAPGAAAAAAAAADDDDDDDDDDAADG